MAFEIDTGQSWAARVAGALHGEWGPELQPFTDAIQDMLPPDATDAQFYDCVADMLLGAFCAPVKAETVRRHFWKFSPLLRHMAFVLPERHDEVILEFIGELEKRS